MRWEHPGRWERLFVAFQHPLGRSGIRRSTVVLVALFVVLAGLLSYHHVTMAPAGRPDPSDDCPPQFIACVPANVQHVGNRARHGVRATHPAGSSPSTTTVPFGRR